MISIWNNNYQKKASKNNTKENKKLISDINRDIVVVGGGIAGVLTAYQLTSSGANVCLVEAKTLFSGVTGNTTGHIDAMHGIFYSDLIKSNENLAKLFFQSQIDAIEEYEKIINELNIKCDFVKQDSYLYSVQDVKKLKDEYDALLKINAEVEFIENPNILNFDVQGAIKLKNQAVFSPLDFLSNLPKNFEIIENTRIIKIDCKNKILYSNNAKIKANKIVIATGFPIVDIPGFFFMKMYKSMSYIIAFENNKKINGVYQSDVDNGLTYRKYRNNIIIGGLDHRAGRVNQNDKFERLEEKANLSFSDVKVAYKWSANDCITSDGIPYIGQISSNIKDVYVITGFNKWGMANSMIGSMVLSDLINEKENKYIELFSPSRNRNGIGFYIMNTLTIVKDLILKPISIPLKTDKSLEPDSGGIVLYKGKKKAVYKDKDGKLYVIEPLCKHLKCQLCFNPNTKTWDCPCHGSRYDIYGNIIVSPSVEKLNKN